MSAEYVPVEVDVHEAQRLLQENPDAVLIDCREADEYAIAHIQGSILMPLSEIQQHVNQLDSMKSKKILVHCHHGGRSMRMVQWMRKNGFSNCLNVAGGIDAWSLEIDPKIPRY